MKNVKVAKTHKDQLQRIKDNISDSYVYFQKNRQYFNSMRNFVFNTTITDDQRSALQGLDMPLLEFNVLEAYISRLCGEFSKQIPGINVFADPTVSVPPDNTIEFVQNHMRHIVTTMRANEIYKDLLSGGFSVLKVWTDYENHKTFKQKICIDRAYDPLLCGFAPDAQKPHKGDGSYCFELIPLSESQFRSLFGDVDVQNCFTGSFENFKWGYKSQRKNVIIVCDYYEKKSRQFKLYELPNGMTLTEDEYQDYLNKFEINNDIRQPMIPVNTRKTNIPYVCRYRLVNDKVLEYVETQFTSLPLIFVDGNSITIRKGGDGGNIEQITRSYAHNAVGTQKLKNLAGQTIANHIETMVKHKMKIAIESIPKGLEEAYRNPQQASNYLYHQYSEDGLQQYNPPQEVVPVQLPPEIVGTFMSADQTIQASLGSYDAALGINKNQLSGVAIVEGATQSNAAAMPFVMGYLDALQQAAEIILDQIPKIYVTPRSLPIINGEDKNEHVAVNDPSNPESPQLKFNSDDLKVEVKAGVNFEVQKNRALQMLFELAQALPGMAQLINNPKGLSIVADNLSFKGADQIKQLAEKESEQMEANKGQPPPPNPVMVKLNLEQQKAASKDQNEKAGLSLKSQEIQNKRMEALLKASDSRFRTAADIENNRIIHAHKSVDQHLQATKIDNDFAKGLISSASNLMSQTEPDQPNLPQQSQTTPQEIQQ